MGGVAEVIYPKEFYIPVLTGDEHTALIATSTAANIAPACIFLDSSDNKLYYCVGRSPYADYGIYEAQYKIMPSL